MTGKSNETVPNTRDSFYDEDDDENNENRRPPSTPVIASIRIVTSKPPVYRRQSHSSSSPSRSSCDSDHDDVTDVSSLGNDHHQPEQQQQQRHHRHRQQQQEYQEKYENRQRKQDLEGHHPFHLQSMKNVLIGSSVPTSRPPSPENSQQALSKKQVRIITDETDKSLESQSQRRHRHNHNSHHQQPYIHGHTKDYRRIRMTSSAINRQKQQQKIERENLKLLERLQRTNATRSLKRDELLSHYDRQMGYVSYTVPSMPEKISLPSRPSSATIMSSTFSTSGKKSNTQSRPSSASNAMNSNTLRSRPASASTSIHGSSRSSSARRPIWNDRWQQNE